MINFSKISNDSLIGKLLRLPLRLIPNNAVLPIIQGPLKGFKWIKGSGVNGYWLGTYERKKQSLISTYIKQGMVCYDIGAHVGYYSLTFSKLVGESGKVFSFEPNPLNLMYLLKHLRLNQVENVFVFPIALGENQDFVPLVLRSSESYLDKKKKGFYSPVFRVDDLISQGHIVLPDIVKIDVLSWLGRKMVLTGMILWKT
jgi:FkbM family methyltransferase